MARKPGLGKGLGALIPENETPMAEAAITTTSEGPLRRVPVQSIRPNPYQPRKAINDESLVALASSVKELGTTNSSPANDVGERRFSPNWNSCRSSCRSM
jgi:ParB family chromosome partitioning protein